LDEAAQKEPVLRSEKDAHDIEGTETVLATVPNRSVDPKCMTKTGTHRAEVIFTLNSQDALGT